VLLHVLVDFWMKCAFYSWLSSKQLRITI